MNKKFVLPILIMMLSTGSASAQEGMAARGCVMGDLVGSWEMVQIKSQVKRQRMNPFFSKSQNFIFNTDGTMKILGSHKNKKIKNRKRQDKLKEILSATYSVDEQDVLSLIAENSKKSEYALCSYVTEEVKAADGAVVFEKGDINLTYVDPQNKIIAMKALRKEK